MTRYHDRHILSGYLCAIAATAIWSGNFIIARGLNDTIPPISLAFWRWVVAVVVCLPFALKPLIAEWDILKANIGHLCITSLLGISLFNTLIYFAGHTTTAINLSLISITFPIFIVIFSRIYYGELITANKALGILLVATGVVLLITNGDLSKLISISFAIGDFWMLVAAIIFAIYSLLVKNKPEGMSIWAFQLSTFLLGLIFLLPFYVWESMTIPVVQFEAKTIFSILYVGIFASLSAFVLWNKAITKIGPFKAGMIYYLLPLFSGLLAHLVLSETISSIHLYSLLLIVPGIVTANYNPKKANTSH